MPALKIDRRRDAEEGGDIACAQPLMALDKSAAFVDAMRYHQRIDHRLMLPTDMEKARALGRAKPLVKVAAVHIGADGSQIDGQLPRGMGAVNYGGDAAFHGRARKQARREKSAMTAM